MITRKVKTLAVILSATAIFSQLYEGIPFGRIFDPADKPRIYFNADDGILSQEEPIDLSGFNKPINVKVPKGSPFDKHPTMLELYSISNQMPSAELQAYTDFATKVEEGVRDQYQLLGFKPKVYEILALINAESGVQHTEIGEEGLERMVESKNGALGLLQMKPQTIEDVAENDVPYMKLKGLLADDFTFDGSVEDYRNNLDTAIRTAILHFEKLSYLQDGDIRRTLCAYNGGNTYTNRARAAAKKAGEDPNDFEVFQKYLPEDGRKETVPYVGKILNGMKTFEKYGFVESVTKVKLDTDIVPRYYDMADKEINTGNGLKGIAYLQDLLGIEGVKPLWQAKIAQRVGMAYRDLGEIDLAVEYFQKSAGYNQNPYSMDSEKEIKKLG